MAARTAAVGELHCVCVRQRLVEIFARATRRVGTCKVVPRVPRAARLGSLSGRGKPLIVVMQRNPPYLSLSLSLSLSHTHTHTHTHTHIFALVQRVPLSVSQVPWKPRNERELQLRRGDCVLVLARDDEASAAFPDTVCYRGVLGGVEGVSSPPPSPY